MRIEKRLNKLDGVTASVNYATEQARVAVPEGVDTDELIAQVEAAGYTARLPQLARPAGDDSAAPVETDETAPLRARLLASLALTVPVILLAMVPALQFDAWQWLSLTLARSEEHTSELQSLMRISYAVFCLKKKKKNNQ